MKKHLLRSLLLAMPALLCGQDSGAIIRPPSTYPELKGFLNLSDAQLQSLLDVQASRNRALQSIYTQMNDKWTALYSLMNSGTGTATQLGQLLLDVGALQRQIPTVDGPYRTQAAAVLNADQKNKLATLMQAVQLQTPSWQAIDLLLIEGNNPVVALGPGIALPAEPGGTPAAMPAGPSQGVSFLQLVPAQTNRSATMRMAPAVVH